MYDGVKVRSKLFAAFNRFIKQETHSFNEKYAAGLCLHYAAWRRSDCRLSHQVHCQKILKNS